MGVAPPSQNSQRKDFKMPSFQETYNPVPMSASGPVSAMAVNLGGFLCSTSGTLQLRHTNVGGAIAVASFPVTAGVWHAIPLAFGSGAYAELGGGATGTFGVM